MALLKNGGTMNLSPPGGPSNPNPNDEFANNDHFLFSNLFNTLPRDVPVSSVPQPIGNMQNRHHDQDIFGPQSNSLGAIGTIGGNSFSHHALNADVLGAIGAGLNLTPSTSPQTSSSTGSNLACGRCDTHASSRCLDCNDILCGDCVEEHRRNNFTREHCLVGLNHISPIGSSVNISNGSSSNDPQCDIHGEILRYVCESCKKVVCQECTLFDHKDCGSIVPVSKVSEGACEKIQSILDSGKLGKKYIKASIDRAVTFSQAVERDAMEATSRIRKAFRHFIMAAEDRERTLLERVDKFRQQKLTSLSDQMAGLRAALAGLSQTSDMLAKAYDSVNTMSNMEIATILSRGEGQTEQFAAMYKNLQPKEEFITFIAPNFELLQDIRLQGDVIMMNQRLNTNGGMSVASLPTPAPQALASTCPISTGNGGNVLTRRPIIRSGSCSVPRTNSAWDQMNLGKSLLSTSPPTINSIAPIPGMPNIGQAIPGSQFHVTSKPALGPSTSFAFDGHGDGQVSRPWGLCVDRDGNILVADRRNNRVQIFYPDGSFKHKFGTKGTGNGEFDLPAGICTDPQNRIIVVDKDNHRIQIFSTIGNFILKFGSYGKDCAQFQYPWDVAANSKGEILVTDSRNHRIQLFNPDGHFISRFSFDGVNHSRYLKGLTTPRGICFTPNGDVIISDFENHRLLLIDATLTKILATKGHEGSGIHEFCRPSGICCDDDGRVIVADSKNQRVVIFSPQLEYLWAVEIRPSTSSLMTPTIDEKDRPSDVALLPDGRLVVMVETSPDARDQCSPQKTFVQIY